MNGIEIKSYIRHCGYAFVTVLLLYGITFCLASCDNREVIPEGNDGKDPATYLDANITVTVLAFGEGGDLYQIPSSPPPEDGLLPSAGVRNVSATNPPQKPEKRAVRIAGDLLMYAALEEDDTPVTLRNVAITPGTRVRIVAYDGSGTTYVDHADYTVITGGILNPINLPLQILATGTYRFVAYSYNSSAAMPAHSSTMTVDVTNDLLWGTATETVSGSALNLHITMKHMFSQAKVDAVLASGSPVIISNFSLGHVGLASYQQPALTVQSGALASGTGSNATFTNPGPYNIPDWISAPQFVYTNSETPTTLILTNLNINGVVYAGPFYVYYAEPLVPGKSYTLKVTFHRTSGGSVDRITSEGSGGNAKLMITRNPNDSGMFFKFGGVVGMNDEPAFNVATTIVFNPLDPSANSSYVITGFGNSTPYLPGVPAFSLDNYDAGINNVSSDVYHNLDSVKAGKGDPCRLIGMTANEIRNFATSTELYAREDVLAETIGQDGQPIGGWRMPSPTENIRFMGVNGSTSYTAHYWYAASSPLSPFGTPPVAGGEFPTRNSLNGAPNPAKFLPALGVRQPTGEYHTTNNISFYWSNTPVLYTTGQATGYTLMFSASILMPQSMDSPILRAFPVRCVRNEQYWSLFGISVNEWDEIPLGGGTSGEGDIILW